MEQPVFQWVIVCELGCWATITMVTITMVTITMVAITMITITTVAITMVAITMVTGFSSLDIETHGGSKISELTRNKCAAYKLLTVHSFRVCVFAESV